MRGPSELLLWLWVRLSVAFSSLRSWASDLAADRDELHRRLMPVAVPIMVVLCQGAAAAAAEAIVIMVSSARGGDVPETARALPGMMSAWSLPLGLVGVALPLAFKGVRQMAALNGGFGFSHARPATAAAHVGAGLAAGAGMWIAGALLSSLMRGAGLPMPSASAGTAAAFRGPVAMLAAGVGAPLAEELLFRGVVSRSLLRSRLLAPASDTKARGPARLSAVLLLAGLSFGVMHVDGSAGPWWALISVAWMTVFGAVQSLLADRLGLETAIASHLAYNASVMAAGLLL